MSSIDNRIVQMEFDNTQFERGVATTMNTLTSLDNQINGLSGSSFGSLSASVDQIADRFSNMGIVAMSIIENITDRVVNLGVNMVKSMSVDQIAAGLQKYEAITTSTVAIVNQADVSFEQAGEYIEKLAWYADATSFDLATMVSALKTFASQGIELDKAIPVIMGIGNSVTFAGQSAKAGSAAFDAYAKAIATGYLDNRAWITLNRGLGITTMKLKQQLIDAAVAEGTLTKAGEGVWKTHEGLEVTLENLQTTLGNQKGKWATTSVLMRLFGGEYGKLTNKVSDLIAAHKEETGWTLTLEEAYEKFGDQLREEFGPELYELGKSYLDSATKARTFSEAVDAVKDAVSTSFSNMFTAIFGNPDEAIELWTQVNDFLVTTINGPISNFANMLKEWHDLGGRTELINGIKAIYNGFKAYLKPLSDFIDEIKPKVTVEGLKKLSQGIESFGNKVNILFNSDQVEIWRGRVDKARTTIRGAISEEKEWHDLVQSTGMPRHRLIFLTDQIMLYDDLTNIIKGFVDALRLIKDSISIVIQPFKQLEAPIKYVASRFVAAASNIGDFISQVANSGEVTNWLSSRLGPLYTVIGWISDAIKKVADALFALTYHYKVYEIIDSVGNFISQARPLEGTIRILESLFDVLKRLWEPLKYAANGILEIVSTLAEYAANIYLSGDLTNWFIEKLELLNPIIDFIGKGIEKITDLFVKIISAGNIQKATEAISSFFDAFRPIEWLVGVGETFFSNIAEGIKKIGKAISDTIQPIFDGAGSGGFIGKLVSILLAAKVLIESGDNIFTKGKMFSGIKNFLKEITDLITGLGEAVSSFIKKNKVETFQSVAKSLLLMAAALFIVSAIKMESLATGFAALAASMVMIVEVSKKISNIKNISGVGSLIGIATSVIELSLALKIIGDLDWQQALQGLVGVSALLWELVGVLAVTKNFGKNSVTNLVTLSEAVLILTASVAALGYINRDALIQGGVAVTAILAVLLGFMAIIQKIDTKGFAIAMFGVAELSAALVVMSATVAALGLIPWNVIANGLKGIAGILIEIGVFAAAMKNISGQMVILGAGMVEIAAAFAILSVAMMAISAIGLDNMTIALVGLGLALAEIGAFTYLLAGLAPNMLVLGAALTVMSAGILVLSAAFAVLAAIGLPGIGTALLAVLGALIAFGTAGAIIGGAAVVGMLAFAAGLAAISAALIVLGEALIRIATACLLFKTAFGQTSTDVTNQFTQSSNEISKSAKDVEKDVTESAKSIENQVKESSNSVENDIDSTNSEVESSTNSMLGEIKNSWSVSSEDMAMSTTDLTSHLKEKFAEMGIELPASADQISSLVSADFASMNTDSTGEVEGMSTDVSKYFSDMGVDLASQTSGIGSNLSISWKDIGHNLMEGLKQGIRNKWNSMLETMAALGNDMQEVYRATNGISSPSKVFAKYGEYIDQGLINGINSYSSRVMGATENLGESVLNAFSDPIKQVASIADSDFTISPKITPVLDTTSIQNGKNYLESMFSGRSLSSSINGNINANLSAMSGISGDIGSLKNEIARMVAGQLNETVLSQALATAMKNVDLYMDGAKVGKMITSYQSSVNRAGGI